MKDVVRLIPLFAVAAIVLGCASAQLANPPATPTNLPATIVGDIEWSQATWNLPLDANGNPDAAKVDAQLTITACEHPRATAGQFFTPCRTVGTGHITSVTTKALSAQAPGKVSATTVFAARYQIPVIGLSGSESVSISVEPGAAFQTSPDKNSLTYVIPADRSTLPLMGGETLTLNWNIEVVRNVCDD